MDRTNRVGTLLSLIVLLLLALPGSAQYTITTIAGGGPPDGTPAAMVGFAPNGVAVDGYGNVYIPSNYDCRVYKLVPNGTMTTVAGNVACGYSGDNGPATGAELNGPSGVAVDGAGNLYIADIGNQRIRMVSGGVITTVAGNGTPGYSGDNGPAASAELNNPLGVAVDNAGNLFIADELNNLIRKVSGGVITTVAGNGTAGDSGDGGPAISATIRLPYGVAVDSAGIFYIADAGNDRIRKVSGGVITTVAGNGIPGHFGDNGPATSAELWNPSGVAVDSSGNVYIVDSSNHRIRKVSGGVITTVAGNGTQGYSGDGGPPTSAQLNYPSAVAVDSAGNLFIADSANARIRKVSGGVITTLAGNGTYCYSGDNGVPENAQLSAPTGVATDGAGNLFIADHLNNRIRKVSGGVITSVASNGTNDIFLDNLPATNAALAMPFGVAVETAGIVYIADNLNERVRKVSGGVITTVAGNGGSGFSGDNGPATSAQFDEPHDVAVDSAGNLYVADIYNNRIRKISGGVITTVAGNGIAGYSGDNGPATSAGLYYPSGVAVDDTGNLYIADSRNNRIRKVSNGVITTVAGNGTQGYSGDGGPALGAALKSPTRVAVDSAGNLFITDSGSLVRKISGGLITTIAGSGTPGYSGDGGPAIDAKLSSPYGIAVDGNSGKIYIGDYNNNRVRQLTPAATTITTLSPSSAPAGTGLTLTVNGTNFVNGDTVLWNGTPLTTTFGGSTQLTAAVPAGLLHVTGTAAISVAVFGGGASNTAAFSITPALPLPSAPVQTSPSNGQLDVSLTPALTWNAANGATSYDLYFGTVSPPPFLLNTAGTSYLVGALLSTAYFWKVCAKNSAGTACSDTWQFTTAASLFPPVLRPYKVNFGVAGASVTPSQTVLVSTYPGVAWTAATTAGYLTIAPASGVGFGSFQVSLVPSQLPAGTTQTAVIVVTGAGQGTQVDVMVTRSFSAKPFGSFDTPTNNSTGVAGSIAVTGWALDNIAIAKVDIWRERIGSEPTQPNGLVYIGDAVFIPGARPDVEAAYPASPQNDQAGWGYLMLTNFLPNSDGTNGTGNGTYKIHAIVHNSAGQTLDLGAKTITCDNAHADRPFGAIDTPGQGDTISGAAYVNYGWVLAHQPNTIPADGHTIDVVIDGKVVGHPVYNNFRPDIATLFPGYTNSNNAVGYFIIDTTKMTNGLHTIAWIVTDNAGNADGIGSRFFTVLNGSGSSAPAVTKSVFPARASGVKLRRGYSQTAQWERLTPEPDGTYSVMAQELERLELQVGAAKGYAVANGKRHPLPTGSSLENGVFRWQLGPGFLGRYDLEFEGQIRVGITVRPQSQAVQTWQPRTSDRGIR